MVATLGWRATLRLPINWNSRQERLVNSNPKPDMRKRHTEGSNKVTKRKNSMDLAMYRTRQSNLMLWIALSVLWTAGLNGCGRPLMYHFKHYQSPFSAIARSNQTYFHSSQSGKIIEKDPCMNYSEPGCYGYEPTTWTHWSPQCPGNFPVQGEPSVGHVGPSTPYEGQVITDSEVIMNGQGVILNEESQPTPAEPTTPPEQSPATDSLTPEIPIDPTTPDEPDLPSIQVPSLPTDIESAVPSPSDSTQRLPKLETQIPTPTNQPTVRLPSPKETVVAPMIPATKSFSVQAKSHADKSSQITKEPQIAKSPASTPQVAKSAPKPRTNATVQPSPQKLTRSSRTSRISPSTVTTHIVLPSETLKESSKSRPLAERIRVLPIEKSPTVSSLPVEDKEDGLATKVQVRTTIVERKSHGTTPPKVASSRTKTSRKPSKAAISISDRPALEVPVAKKIPLSNKPVKVNPTPKKLADRLRVRIGTTSEVVKNEVVTKPEQLSTGQLKLGETNKSTLTIVDKKGSTSPKIVGAKAKLDEIGKTKNSPESKALATKLQKAHSDRPTKTVREPVTNAAKIKQVLDSERQKNQVESPIKISKVQSTHNPSTLADKITRSKTIEKLSTQVPNLRVDRVNNVGGSNLKSGLNLLTGPNSIIRFAESDGNATFSRISAQKESELRIVK